MLEDAFEDYSQKYKKLLKEGTPPPPKNRKPEQEKAIEERKEDLLPEEIRSEVNFLVLPFFALSRKRLGETEEIEYRHVVARGDKKIEIVWNVSSNPKYGFPGPFDKKVHKAIEWIISRKEPPISNPVRIGSLYRIAKIMDLESFEAGGKTYKAIKEALERLIATTVKSRGAYYSKEKQRWIEDVFHLFDRVVFEGEELSDSRVADTNCLFLSSWYLKNLNSRYVKPLDYHYYKSLESTIAARLYELLGVKFFGLPKGQPFLRYRYSTLCQLLPIARQEYLSWARQNLDPAHKELQKTRFLKEYRWEEVQDPARENGPSDWYIYYYPGTRAREEIRKAHLLSRGPNAATTEHQQSTAQKELLVKDILQVTGDPHSRPFYWKIAREVPEHVIRQALSETKTADKAGRADNPAKYFTYLIRKFQEDNRQPSAET